MSRAVEQLQQQKTNADKLDRAKAVLGTKWILHPANRVAKKCPSEIRTQPSSRS